jgi:hypothetical protein
MAAVVLKRFLVDGWVVKIDKYPFVISWTSRVERVCDNAIFETGLEAAEYAGEFITRNIGNPALVAAFLEKLARIQTARVPITLAWWYRDLGEVHLKIWSEDEPDDINAEPDKFVLQLVPTRLQKVTTLKTTTDL